MKAFRRKVEESAWILGVHNVIVRLHRSLYEREDSSTLAKLYSSMLPPNALAFDIGANTGIYSEALLLAGARVVAVEPNPDCLRHIELTYGKRYIQTLQCAVGHQNGVASLRVYDEWDDASTIGDGLSGEQHLPGGRIIAIPVVTLDSLIAHFGMPDYIKIDVEGCEAAVLKGLSKLPALLSFEFHHLYAERALSCLDSLLFAGECRFNVTDETGTGLRLERWVGLQEIKEIGTEIIRSKTYRDIYVRAES